MVLKARGLLLLGWYRVFWNLRPTLSGLEGWAVFGPSTPLLMLLKSTGLWYPSGLERTDYSSLSILLKSFRHSGVETVSEWSGALGLLFSLNASEQF